MGVTMKDRIATLTLPSWLDDDGLAALGLELTQVLGDDHVAGIVLSGGPRAFCLGLPIDSPQTDAARDLARHIRAARKPVIAAMRGVAQGAGLELALAARMRVAHPGARLSLPQIRNGLPPSALGTQTLPPLIGATAALQMILGGAALRADTAPEGLIDLIDDAPEDAAHALAAVNPTAPDRMGLSDPQAFLAAIARSRSERSILSVRGRIVDCIEAALILPGFAAESMESQTDADAHAGDASKALRRVARDEAANTERWMSARLPARIAIVGGTATAGRLAETALRAGASVDLIALDDAGLAQAAGTVIDRVEALAAKGGIDAESIDTMLAQFRPGVDMDALRQVNLVVEAATGDATLRAELAQAVELFTEAGVPIVLGGLRSDPPALVSDGRKGDVLGLHLPPETDALAEIAVTSDTGEQARQSAAALARAIGRRPILTGPAAGRIVARLAEVSLASCEAMVVEGALPDGIERALKSRLGIARGPLQTAQARGLKRLQTHRERMGWGQGGLIDILLRAGLETLDDIGDVAAELRVATETQRRAWTDDDIVTRWLADLTAEAAQMLMDGTARRAGDLNLASIAALGLPRLTGGLLYAADRAGLLQLQNALRAADRTPPALLQQMIKNGQHFGDL